MGLYEDSEENSEKRFEDLCLDLNLDNNSKEEAWHAFQRISQNYTLEGDSLHWLACALYVACRQSVQTVRGEEIEGNCVSLTRLLRSSKLSLLNFFNKMKKWSDMANLPQEFRDKVDRLERNFAVSTVIFKKFEPIYKDIFRDPGLDAPRPPRGRKQKRLPCSSSEVFAFCWTMFVQVKGNFPAISDDLVNSYHLLLCCVDWFYANALHSNKDLLNPEFEGLPDNFAQYKAGTEVPCILALLCNKHEGLVIEAKGIKEHWWKPYIKKLFDRKVLKGKIENMTGILDISFFESNVKSINNAYETYVLSVGDFDERIFLGEDADMEIGTPAKNQSDAELASKMMMKREMVSAVEPGSLVKQTPLTGRRYLGEKETPVTPVSTATQSVSKLQSLLSGRKTCPSDELKEIFKSCAKNPEETIVNRVKQMGETFCTSFAQPSEDHPGTHADFAKKRLQLGESLYYKALENIMSTERKRKQASDKNIDFSGLLNQDSFHRSLFACALEIVLFSYNSQRTFPWNIEIFELSPYHFYKVIELIIRAEDSLSRDVVKHLNHIEEMILECEAFKYNSPLWEAIKLNGGEIPRCDEVSLPSMMERDSSQNEGLQSPLLHPAVKRIAGVTSGERRTIIARKDILQSPTGPSAADRFISPSPGSCKRRLFTTGTVQGSSTFVSNAGASEDGASGSTSNSQSSPQQVTFYQQAQTEDGTKVLIPVQILSPGGSFVVQSPNRGMAAAAGTTAYSTSSAVTSNKPKKTGSLALFFRKVYHLASVRLRLLCEMLEIDNELRSQIWTCFEHTLVMHSGMFVDRHLDQLLMCAVYVMAKVSSKDRSFQDIMKCYRLQPQARSHVYRSVLLTSRRRRMSGESDNGKDSSRSNSPSQSSDDKEEKKKNIRSTSTLPVAHPGSQPPTPTRLAGTASSFEFEDRGDLIKFYNQEYIKKIKNFALKFSSQNGEAGAEVPPLSPLPVVRSQRKSPRRVSQKHPVYISPIKSHYALTPQSKMLYCFNRSPAKELQAINRMLIREHSKPITAGKRLLVEDMSTAESPPVKRALVEKPQILKRVEEVMNDRGTR